MTPRRNSRESLPTTPELIARKRDRGELSADEIRALVEGFVDGRVADYQMSALAMAIYLRGMTPAETAALTLAMRDSGNVADLSRIAGRKVDKHSTGGVGDKVSICLAPLVAACGVPVPMISGRGLGHTGGTLDKLEAIPGFSTQLSLQGFVRQVRNLGCALIGQTQELAPADRSLYALRDVTATVESIPLITASILSKKLAEGIDGLVLDVKVGRGAFMKTRAEARMLARSLVEVGRLSGKRVTALLTRMDAPLGLTIGNALETAEAFEVLHGSGPQDLVECTMALGSEMLQLGGVASDDAEARATLAKAIEDGSAAERMRRIIEAQGGDPRALDEPDRLPRAGQRVHVRAERDGYLHGIHARSLGMAAIKLGAGRTRADDAIDPAVGMVLARKPGDVVKAGEPLLTLHVARKPAPAVLQDVGSAFDIGDTKPRRQRLVIEALRG